MKHYTIFSVFLFVFVFQLTNGISQEQASAVPEEAKPQTGMGHLWGLGVKAGLNGVGGEVVKGFGNRLNVRLGYSTLVIPFSTDQELQGYNMQFDAKVTFGGGNLFIDFYPIKNIFHLTGGLVLNKTMIDIKAISLSTIPFGDLTIPEEQVGTVALQLGPGRSISPYVAIGFGNTLSRKHRLSVNFEFGTFYQGAPKIKLNGNGVIGPIANETNATIINNAIAQYSWFPMLNFQMTYRIL
jgi:hypothetical protein